MLGAHKDMGRGQYAAHELDRRHRHVHLDGHGAPRRARVRSAPELLQRCGGGPPGAKERTAWLRSGWCDDGPALAPPSDEPALTSTMTPRERSTRSGRNSGQSARMVAVALQPTPLTCVAPTDLPRDTAREGHRQNGAAIPAPWMRAHHTMRDMVGWRAQAKVGREVDDSRRQCTANSSMCFASPDRGASATNSRSQGSQHRDRIVLERRSPTQIRVARMHKTCPVALSEVT
jgi:hypothetical protein